jgi:hypothetical protein
VVGLCSGGRARTCVWRQWRDLLLLRRASLLVESVARAGRQPPTHTSRPSFLTRPTGSPHGWVGGGWP